MRQKAPLFPQLPPPADAVAHTLPPEPSGTQYPPQHSSGEAQAVPLALHPASSVGAAAWHTNALRSDDGPQLLLQQSGDPAHVAPAARQVGPPVGCMPAAHAPWSHKPEQQWRSSVQKADAAAHAGSMLGLD